MNKQTIIINSHPKDRRVAVNIYTAPNQSQNAQCQARSGKEIVLLFGHANGFHKELWEPIISDLLLHLDAINSTKHYVQKAIAFDFSTQGDSTTLNEGLLEDDTKCDWIDYGREVLAIVEQLNLDRNNAIAIGHSMGACSFLLAEIQRPTLFKGIIAVEPVLRTNMPRPYLKGPLSYVTMRRKNGFSSKDEALKYYKSKAAYAAWDPEILNLHVEHGLIKIVDGNQEKYVLKCKPALEANTYDGAFYGTKLFAEKSNLIQCRTVLISGKDSAFSKAQYAIDFVNSLPNGKFIHLPEGGHLLPMEIPVNLTKVLETQLKALLE